VLAEMVQHQLLAVHLSLMPVAVAVAVVLIHQHLLELVALEAAVVAVLLVVEQLVLPTLAEVVEAVEVSQIMLVAQAALALSLSVTYCRQRLTAFLFLLPAKDGLPLSASQAWIIWWSLAAAVVD
jgi:hypothetical protein